MKTNRNYSIDFLRIISCIAVVLIHTNYYYFKDEMTLPNLGSTYTIESLINIVMRFSVPVFVMISDALNLSNPQNSDFQYFYKKTSQNIFLPVFIAMVLFAIFEVGFSYTMTGNLFQSIEHLMYSLLIGDFFNLWYMYMLAGLYLLTPFIIRLKGTISTTVYERFALIYLCWIVFSQMFTDLEAAWSIGVVAAYLAYYILGDVIYHKDFKIRFIPAIVLGMLAISISFTMRYWGLTYYLTSPYSGFFSPSIVILSVVLFSFVLKCHVSADYSKIASLSFFIYLFHTIILRFITFVLDPYIEFNEIFKVLIITIIVLIISAIAGSLYQKLWLAFCAKFFDN